ncbi:MAG: ATPase-like protein [Nocardia sp.]|uniref:AfsR/SARP family transcriptional regulator n=1 Tax=Nocardia sp. TaxID=1821 RepID=UPI0026021771|nr:BTAD domain-containing putative transcriptional regulator [Nocardia sp.]MCU1640325.1 ATPase-like protein [Nocardia sp.]
MRVYLLGPLLLDTGNGPVNVGGPRLRALLARLALDAGRAVRAEVLVEALRDDEPATDETNALQSLVSRLRRVLGDPVLLTSGPGGYQLAVEADVVDAVRFEQLARVGRELLVRGQAAEAAATLREALSLWRGPALVDVRGNGFADAAAQRLERTRVTVLENRIEADLELGGSHELIAELEALTGEHPLRERLHAQLIRVLAGYGRGTEALGVYDDVRGRLAEKFGSDPGPELKAAHLAVLRDEIPLRLEMRPIRSRRAAGNAAAAGNSALDEHSGTFGERGHTPGDSRWTVGKQHGNSGERNENSGQRRGNLDAPLTSFVGREDDIRRVVALLGSNRLVTLVGPGGAGKTRLASTAGSELTTSGGVWLVALAPVGAEDVPGAVLDVLRRRGIGLPARSPTPSGTEIVESLIGALIGDDVVLVLDNCEHVIDAVAALAETLLTRCPQLRVLATSREPLRIDGEALHSVRSLDLPAPGATEQQARDCSAIQLFYDRARSVRPEIAADSVAAVVEICRRLDGLPLAIELAAARLRTLPIETIAARLDDRFRLLTRGSRTALPRHQTLRAVVEWSWQLLDTDERTFLERLAVVPDSITEAAAHAIGLPDSLPGDLPNSQRGGLPDSRPGILSPSRHDARPGDVSPSRCDSRPGDLLSALVDKSLLHLAGVDEAGEPRYRMLETIREYGLERLAARDEVDFGRARHTRYLLELVETAEPRLRTADQLLWLARISAERANLLAAIRGAVDVRDGDTAVRFGIGLCWFWFMRGNPPESQELLARIVEVSGAAAQAAQADRALIGTAYALAIDALEPGNAYAEPVEIACGIGPYAHPMFALARLGAALAAPQVAAELSEFSGVSDDGRQDPWDRAFELLLRGLFAMNTGNLTVAQELLLRAVAGFEELGERWGIATALSSLGGALRLSGDQSGALAMNERGTQYFLELGLRDYTIENDVGATLTRARGGDIDGGRLHLEGLLQKASRVDSAEWTAHVRLGLAQLECWAGQYDRAREHALAGLADPPAGEAIPVPLTALLLGMLAQADTADGNTEAALRSLDHPAVHLASTWYTPIAASIAVVVAGIELRRDHPTDAARLLGTAAALRGADDPDDIDVRRITQQANAILRESPFATAYDDGARMPRTEAWKLIFAVIESRRRSADT